MTKMIIILLIGLVFEAIGVVYLSKGIKQIGDVRLARPAEMMRMIGKATVNPNVLRGVLCEALFFAALLILLSKGDVSFVWPLTSLSFVLTAFSAKLFLHEQVSPARWMGICLIMAGAALITWSEQQKRQIANPVASGPARGSIRASL